MMIEPYSVIVQAGPDEILLASQPESLCLASLRDWPTIGRILVVMPELERATEAHDRLASWGFESFIGNSYDLCQRILTAHGILPYQAFAVRALAIWKHIDLEYVDRLVVEMRRSPCDLIAAPRDFDLTMAADVASLQAIQRVGELRGKGAETKRALFNPWGYMESHPRQFDVCYLEPAPKYNAEKRAAILSEQRCHPENEFFGTGYQGSGYHFIMDQVPRGLRVLDIACGSGLGTELLSRKSALVVGVDYSEEYINRAKARFPENDGLRFMVGDGQTFIYDHGKEPFDLVVSFHTLEHVPDDKAMLTTLHRNLKDGGQLVIEVPILSQRPLSQPLNPYHLREYTLGHFNTLISEADFSIERMLGVCRGFYVPIELTREAVQIWARKN